MTKRALCIGINYPGTNAQLAGCVNDALDWQLLLSAQGYEVDLVLDQDATLQNVLAKMTDLVERSRFGDRIVVTYSGHGTWLPDKDGDEADGRDEAMVMVDYLAGGLLVDDTLHEVFSHTRLGVGALILSDSCHSGTLSRLIDLGHRQSGRRKFVSPVEFMDLSLPRAVQMETVKASTPRYTTSLISGCRDTEYSYDTSFNGRPNGAFTRAAIDAWEPGMSLNAWYRAIKKVLPSAEYNQDPQLTTASRYRRYTKAL